MSNRIIFIVLIFLFFGLSEGCSLSSMNASLYNPIKSKIEQQNQIVKNNKIKNKNNKICFQINSYNLSKKDKIRLKNEALYVFPRKR